MNVTKRLLTSLAFSLAAGSVLSAALPVDPDFEFQAAIVAPFKGQAQEARNFQLLFKVSEPVSGLQAAWRLELLDAQGTVLRTWFGESLLREAEGVAHRHWDGLDQWGQPLAQGFYTLRMTSAILEKESYSKSEFYDVASRVQGYLDGYQDGLDIQETSIQVGHPAKPKLLPYEALPGSKEVGKDERLLQSRPATNSFPYVVYYGNLHSHTNHSDGGIAVAECGSGEVPHGGAYGPTDAYTYAKNTAGLDFLLTSDHNHMYDGSSGTNTSLSQATVQNLFNSGLTAASNFRSTNPTFGAMYGVEWGVISNGGHLNILNPDGLPNWEMNSSGQVLGHVNTPNKDYPALYSVMKQRGWVGSFSHPKSSSQFLVGSTSLGYDPNGVEVMALCEVANSSAFSTITNESGTLSSFTSAWNILLERGYKVAPGSNQDNHCANWGSSASNRTAILIPSGTTPTFQAYLDAVRARRTFATADKNSQIILTANGHMMGETFSNSGALTLNVYFANTSGRTASNIQIYEGVPKRNGTVTSLVTGQSTYTLTPTNGDHFYYAVITQDDGKKLWSAPVWVNQGGGGDSEAPVVSATETGTSGSITLNATATDNVGVARVEFYVDGLLKGTDTTSPYSFSLDSTTLANGSHSLVAKAYDAAGNQGVSSSVSFTVNNTDTQAPTVSASASVSGTTVNLSATASDNLGVSKVEFYVDGVLKGTDTSIPYAWTLTTSTLTNGTHTLVVKAYDAANNVGTSSSVTFSITNTDTQAPTVSGSVSGTSGTITLNATATDNTAVTKVEFYVDGALKGSDTTSPYSYSLNSTTLTNGTHALVAKAYDAANNVGTSSTVNFNVSNTTTAVEKILNGGFESGSTSWTATSGVITNDSSQAAHGGSYKAWLCGYGSSHTDTLYQQVTIPSAATQATFSFWLKITSDSNSTTTAYDTLKIQIRNSSNSILSTLATYSNLNKGTSYVQRTFDLSAYKGQTIRVYFLGVEDNTVATSFIVDDVSLMVK